MNFSKPQIKINSRNIAQILDTFVYFYACVVCLILNWEKVASAINSHYIIKSMKKYCQWGTNWVKPTIFYTFVVQGPKAGPIKRGISTCCP